MTLNEVSYRDMFLIRLFTLILGGVLSLNIYSAPADEISLISLNELLSSPALLKNLKNIEHKNKQVIPQPSVPKYNTSAIPPGEDLILSLYIKESKYSDIYISDIFAIKSANNAKVSLTSLFESLDFPIDVDMTNKNVTGWFIKEKNKFTLTFPTQNTQPITANINGTEYPLLKNNYLIQDDDLFVESEVLDQWFELYFNFNYPDLVVHITPTQPLPIQTRLSRKNQQRSSKYNTKAVLPWKESTYQAISAPLLDVQLNSSVNQDQIYGSYSLLSVQDIGYLSSELYLSGNKFDPLNNARLTFSKEDKNRSLLGPLRATRYQFGDVTPVKLANNSTRGENVGLRFSNQKSKAGTDNKTTNINGNAQAGWDAELYRNGLFVDRQLKIQTGRYDFRDVELFFGENKFEIILYGPQGQIQQVSQDYYIDSNILKAQEIVYDLSITEASGSLLGVSDSNSNDLKGWQTAGTYTFGLTDNFSTNMGASYFFNQSGEDFYQYSLGASFTPFKQLIVSSDYQHDNFNNNSLTLNARTLWQDQSLSLNYGQRKYYSQDKIENFSQNYDIIMSGKLFDFSIIPVYYQNEWRHSGIGNTSETKSFTNQISVRSFIGKASNQISWLDTAVNEDGKPSIFGSFELQKHFSTLYTRLETGYRLSDDPRITLLKADLSYPLTHNINSSFDISYTLDNDRYNANLGLNWSFDSLLLSSTAQYNSDKNWSIGLFTSFAFGYEPITQEFFMSKGSLARNGTLVTRVFEDENLNGKFDKGETPLEGVKVKASQSYRQDYTTENGIAVLKNLPSGKRSDIVIDQRTVEDPFIIPATAGVSITARKGYIEVLDIPMVNAGELEGTVYINDKKDNENFGAYLNINLHNAENVLVATTETEFDGYYLFTNIVPGKYTLSISPDDIKRKKLYDLKTQEFEFSAAGDVIAGADIVAQRYSFVKGYVIDLGIFNSLTLLKTYWQIIKSKYNNALQQQVFYSVLEDKKLFRLNAAFFQGKVQAIRACKYLKNIHINCTVEAFEFKH